MSKQNKSRLKVYGFLFLIIVVAASIHFMSPGTDSSQADTGSSSKEAVSTDTSGNQGNDQGDDASASETAKKKDQKEEEDDVPVELHEVSRGEISSFVTATANLRALREVDVASRTDGIVKEMLAEEGDFVKEGQVLCRLDDTQLQIRLQSGLQRLAQAKLQKEKARIRQQKASVQIKNTKEELGRYEDLYKNKLVSESEVAQLRYRLEELEHDKRASTSETVELNHRFEELESENEQIRLEISRTKIKAPFSGHIIQRMVELGRTVRNLESLFKLADFSPLYADVYLSEAEARHVRPGQPATISLGIDETIKVPGRIARISPVVDQDTGTVKVTVELLRSGDAFKPGAFVRVGIKTDTRPDAILIPKQAVMDEDKKEFVFVANGEFARKIFVTLGYKKRGAVEIVAGLSEGQQVVVAGQGALKDGSRINVVLSADPREANVHAPEKANKTKV